MLMCSTASSWSTSSSTTAPVCTTPLATNSLPSSFWYNRPITSVISLRSANLGGLIHLLDFYPKSDIIAPRPRCMPPEVFTTEKEIRHDCRKFLTGRDRADRRRVSPQHIRHFRHYAGKPCCVCGLLCRRVSCCFYRGDCVHARVWH